MFIFFFFKQQTAYEMRISDWSSDVCSSDLRWPSRSNSGNLPPGCPRPRRSQSTCVAVARGAVRDAKAAGASRAWLPLVLLLIPSSRRHSRQGGRRRPPHRCDGYDGLPETVPRSEEHTSELQSLMRSSYAVFCWKKQT